MAHRKKGAVKFDFSIDKEWVSLASPEWYLNSEWPLASDIFWYVAFDGKTVYSCLFKVCSNMQRSFCYDITSFCCCTRPVILTRLKLQGKSYTIFCQWHFVCFYNWTLHLWTVSINKMKWTSTVFHICFGSMFCFVMFFQHHH